MKLALIVRPEAEADVDAAYDWYESTREGLGERFLLSVRATVASISRWPRLQPVIHAAARRALVKRFPYGVYYVVKADAVVVIAVFHSSRDPREWQDRLKD